jgi:phosphoribosyl-ATP pyrophosphohydrolase/phosphoribosyl-AMP cyclohydrolase
MRDRSAPLSRADLDALDWDKMEGLLPAIVQDSSTRQVLMLGYMNREGRGGDAGRWFRDLLQPLEDAAVAKGESSGHHLAVRSVHVDCDGDALLVLAEPAGPTCHLGTASCFSEEAAPGLGWLGQLSRIVRERAESGESGSYTARLLAEGPQRIAQKIGEEGVELALAGAGGEKDQCIEEAADLLYHLAVLMQARDFGWDEVAQTLRRRHEVR